MTVNSMLARSQPALGGIFMPARRRARAHRRPAAPRRLSARGFTLVELLVSVAIVAILAAVAYPTYTNQVAKARRAEIQAELLSLAQFMERIYTETGCYNPGTDMDCSSGTAAAPDISAADDDYDYYGIAFSGNVTADTFLIQATPATGTSQAGDGILRINHLGQRWWDENGDNDVGDANENDWVRN
jgi:type IV pilus assembly protein PilE